jgi:hypothetical protein
MVIVDRPQALVTSRRLMAAGATFADAVPQVDALASAPARSVMMPT